MSAFINIPWGIFWGWVLARKNFRGKALLQSFLYIPLVLPPVLTGYFLLLLLGRTSPLGSWFQEVLGLNFMLDWKGVVVASSIVASPFMIITVKQAIEQIDERLERVARSLGADFFRVLFTVTLPLSWTGIIAGFFLVFARSVGEFGATIIVAGNIPGKTQTIPLAIYSKVYLGQEAGIAPLVVAALALSYLGLGLSQKISEGKNFGAESGQ